MAEKEKKRAKIHKILSVDKAEELAAFLENKHGAQKEMAEEIGKTEQAVTGWMKTKRFPQYCAPYLEKLKLIENLTGEKK